MGKGRAPCCDKSKVKRGPWSAAEDLKLITFIQKHGHDNWRALPKQAGLLRCGKSCRLRWINYLRPDVKRGNFTPGEELTIIRLHSTLGNKWSKIASHLPGRTDNEIKNVWNTHLKKKLSCGSAGDGVDKVNRECDEESPVGSSASSSSRAIMSSCKRSSDDEHPPKPMEAQESSEVISSTSQGAAVTMKEQSSSSCSSDKSNIASGSSQVDAGTARPEHQMGSSALEFGRLGFNNLEEVNKPDTVMSISDPFEYDFDFWSMLDNLGTLQSNETTDASASFGEASRETIDSTRRWFQDLEHELGLREATTEDGDSAATDPKSPETLLKPDVDPGITYFQLWNASTQSSAS